MTYSKEFLSLYNDLYAVIDYPQALSEEVHYVAELWKDFCSLPHEIKKQCSFKAQHEDWNSGYILREGKGHDHKEYYHVQPNHNDLVYKHELNQLMSEYPIVKEFFQSAESVVGKLRDFIEHIAHDLSRDNKHLENLVEQFRSGYEQNYGVLRFLHYTPDPKQTVIAEPHFDIGGMTFHVYESNPGLQFLSYNLQWMNAPLIEGKTLMFNAYGLERLSGGVLQRTWHRVIQKPGIEQERYSAVFFADFPDGLNWDTETMGRAKLQPQSYKPKSRLQ